MTDEEKKAIEIIKFLQDKCIHENGTGMMPIYRIDDLANAIKILLNLIEKQQKEIEELKMITKEYDSFLGNEKIIIADKSYFDKGYFKEKFISKDKIKPIQIIDLDGIIHNVYKIEGE